MRRCAAWLLVTLMLLAALTPAAAETVSTAPDFVMAGYDDESVGHDWDENLFFQRMEEKTGVTFIYEQYDTADNWQMKKDLYLLGQEQVLPDVLFKAALSYEDQLKGYEKGVLIDLKLYLEQYAPNLWALLQQNPEWLRAISLPDGAIVALPGITEMQNNNAMWINTVWLDNLNLKMPTTADELTQVLRAFLTGDPNKNGRRDEVPMTFTGMWDLRWLSHAYGFISNDYYVYADNDVVSGVLTTEQNRQFLTWLHQLWGEGLLDKSGFSTADTVRRVTDTNAAMTYGVIMGPTPMTMIATEGMSEYALLMPLVYEGKQVYRDFAGSLNTGAYAITSYCKEPEKLVAWVDYLYTPEGCYLMQAGQEGVEYNWNSDGTWSWVYDAETMAGSVLAEATISDGGSTPGISLASFQLAFDDEETQKIIRDLIALSDVARMPYPTRYLDNEQQARVDAIQADLAAYAEQQMVWFVTGETALTDESWSAFCQTVESKGMNEMVSIWQRALH